MKNLIQRLEYDNYKAQHYVYMALVLKSKELESLEEVIKDLMRIDTMKNEVNALHENYKS